MAMPRLWSPGAAKATVPRFLADVIPGDSLSSLTTEAGVSFGPPHCKKRIKAWRAELKIKLSDQNYVIIKTTLLSLFETNLYSLNLSSKGKVSVQACLGTSCK